MNILYFLAASSTTSLSPKSGAQDGLSKLGVDSTKAEADFTGKLTEVLNWIFGIIGIVAVIMIILGGFTLMTSSGDPGKVKKGKDTILYGVIGLVVALLAVVIVNFVINKAL